MKKLFFSLLALAGMTCASYAQQVTTLWESADPVVASYGADQAGHFSGDYVQNIALGDELLVTVDHNDPAQSWPKIGLKGTASDWNARFDVSDQQSTKGLPMPCVITFVVDLKIYNNLQKASTGAVWIMGQGAYISKVEHVHYYTPKNIIELSLYDLNHGWGSSYDATTRTITFDKGWQARGWSFSGNRDFSDCESVTIEVEEPVTNYTKLVVTYSDNTTSTNGADNGTKFTCDLDPALSSEVKNIFLQTAEAGTLTLKAAFLTKKGIPVGADGYGTYYNATTAMQLPAGATAYVIDPTANPMMRAAYPEYSTIPAGEPVIVKGDPMTFVAATATESATPTQKSLGKNALCGAADDMTAADMTAANPGQNSFYALSLDADGQNVGFYWVNDGGAAFDINAGKAYLVMPQSASATEVHGWSIKELETVQTAISNLKSEAGASVRFDLSGRRSEAAGFMIQNGKVVFVK